MLSLHNFLNHILEETNYVLSHTNGMSEETFLGDETLTRAVVRSLEIIGEATKKLSPDFKSQYPNVEWKKMSGTRDILIHEYFGVDWEIVWDIIMNKLPKLKEDIEAILQDIDSQ